MLPIIGRMEVISPVDAFILDVSVYIDILRPKQSFIFREDFDPASYFVTSGDAIEKTKNLSADLKKYKYDIIRTVEVLGSFTDIELEFVNQVDTAIENSQTMLADLYAAKGENCFLETEWESHEQKVVPKNPRR